MTLLTIAEVMSGEALVSPGGPIDRDTAAADDVQLWHQAAPGEAASDTQDDGAAMPHRVLEPTLSSV
jgi:hypothetical protein